MACIGQKMRSHNVLTVYIFLMGIQLVLVAGFFVALSNYFMRKSIDAGGSTKAFLTTQLFLTFLIAILLNPVRTGEYGWSNCMAAFGLAGGIVLGAMMASLGRSVETGPPGLSFAMLSSATVMPILVMVFFFGEKFGFIYTLANGLGSLIVVAGLFWAGYETVRTGKMAKWLTFAITAFILHVIFLVFMQWRALFINFPGENGLMLSFDVDDALSQWFMPMVFCSATFIQGLIYFSSQKKLPHKSELLWGTLGGIANGIGTFFLIRATEVSTPLEHAMIFPIYAITIIALCNLWGQWIYREKVNWKASSLCIFGILIGTINWKSLFG